MALIAGLRPGTSLLDPFAGIGTIAIEAMRLQPLARAVGGDIEGSHLRDAAMNARNAGVDIPWVQLDSGHLPWSTGAFHTVVSNAPWGRAVPVRGALVHSPHTRDHEIARVLAPGGRAVLLLHDRDPLASGSVRGPLTLRHRFWLSVSGLHPRLSVLVPSGTGRPTWDGEAALGRLLERFEPYADTREA
jgi:tRNA G10  N-methylase Trm11